jgi:hypothetical protein
MCSQRFCEREFEVAKARPKLPGRLSTPRAKVADLDEVNRTLEDEAIAKFRNPSTGYCD